MGEVNIRAVVVVLVVLLIATATATAALAIPAAKYRAPIWIPLIIHETWPTVRCADLRAPINGSSHKQQQHTTPTTTTHKNNNKNTPKSLSIYLSLSECGVASANRKQ